MAHSLVLERDAPRAARRVHPSAGTPFESLAVSFRVIRRLVADQLSADDLAVTDFWALSWMCDGVTSPTALGHLLALTPAGMTQLLDRLENRKLVSRAPNPGDRRATVLVLTAKGRELQRRTGNRSARFLEHLGAELSPEGLEGLRVLSRELDAILARRTAAPSHGA